jgi:hypothetical protein
MNSRANESVSCDLCHTVSGFDGDTPYNFNWISEPADGKQNMGHGVQEIHRNIKLLNQNFLVLLNFAEHVIMKKALLEFG